MVATELQQLHLLAHGLELTQQGATLVEIVLSKADEQPLATMLLAANQTVLTLLQKILLTAHTQPRGQFPQ